MARIHRRYYRYKRKCFKHRVLTREYSSSNEKNRKNKSINRQDILQRFADYYDAKLKKHRLDDRIPWDSHSFSGQICYELVGSYELFPVNSPIVETDLHTTNDNNQYYLQSNNFAFTGQPISVENENKQYVLTPKFTQAHKINKQVFCQSELDMYPYNTSYLFISNYDGKSLPISNVATIGVCPASTEEKQQKYVPAELQGKHAFLRYSMNSKHLSDAVFQCITPTEMTSSANTIQTLWENDSTENHISQIMIAEELCENLSDGDKLICTIDTVADGDHIIELYDVNSNLIRRVPKSSTFSDVTSGDEKTITLTASEADALQGGFTINANDMTISKVVLNNAVNVTPAIEYHTISSILVNSYCTYNGETQYKPLVVSEGGFYPLTSYAYTISDFSRLFKYKDDSGDASCYVTTSKNIAINAFANIDGNKSGGWMKTRLEEKYWKQLAYKGVIYAYNTTASNPQPYIDGNKVNFDAWKNANRFVFAKNGLTKASSLSKESYPKGKRISKKSHEVFLFDNAAQYAYFGNVCLDLFDINNYMTVVNTPGIPSKLQSASRVKVSSANPNMQGTYTITFKPEVDRNDWIDYASVRINTHSVSVNNVLLVNGELPEMIPTTEDEITTWTCIANTKFSYFNFVTGQNEVKTSNYKCSYSIDGSEYIEITNNTANNGYFTATHNGNQVNIPPTYITYYKDGESNYEWASLTSPYKIGYEIKAGEMNNVVIYTYIKNIDGVKNTVTGSIDKYIDDATNTYMFLNKYELCPVQKPVYKLVNTSDKKLNTQYECIGYLVYKPNDNKASTYAYYYQSNNLNGTMGNIKVSDTYMFSVNESGKTDVEFKNCEINDTYVTYACTNKIKHEMQLGYTELEGHEGAIITNICGSHSSSYNVWSIHKSPSGIPTTSYYNLNSILINDPNYYDTENTPRITLNCAHKSNLSYINKFTVDFQPIDNESIQEEINGEKRSRQEYNYILHWQSNSKSLIGMSYWLENLDLGTTSYIFDSDKTHNERYIEMLVSGGGIATSYSQVEFNGDYKVKMAWNVEEFNGKGEYHCDLQTYDGDSIFDTEEGTSLIEFTGEYPLNENINCDYFYINNNKTEYIYSVSINRYPTLIYLLKNKLINNEIVKQHISGKIDVKDIPVANNHNLVITRDITDNGIECLVYDEINNGDVDKIGTIDTRKYILTKRQKVSNEIIESLGIANDNQKLTYVYGSYEFHMNKKLDTAIANVISVYGLEKQVQLYHMYASSYTVSYQYEGSDAHHTIYIRKDFGSANNGNSDNYIYNTFNVDLFNPIELDVTANPNNTDQDIFGVVELNDTELPIDNKPYSNEEES